MVILMCLSPWLRLFLQAQIYLFHWEDVRREIHARKRQSMRVWKNIAEFLIWRLQHVLAEFIKKGRCKCNGHPHRHYYFYKGEALPPFDARKGTWWWLDTYDGKHFAWCSTSIERAQGKRNHKEREKKKCWRLFSPIWFDICRKKTRR